jgi:predicted nucleic acid-binding protein
MEANRAALMTLVTDASIAVAWFLPDEVCSAADNILRRVGNEGAYVPDLFWHEMRNVLMMCCRRQRLLREEARHSIETCAAQPFDVFVFGQRANLRPGRRTPDNVL